MQERSALYRQLAQEELHVIDDFGLIPLADEIIRDLLEILDDRFDQKSTLITSQLPVEQWHTHLGDRTAADAILDRLLHNSHRMTLNGESMRKRNTTAARTPSAK
jgi:DNA replication protein DnaC